MSDEGPREEDGDYAKEFFDTYERAADEVFAYPYGKGNQGPGTGPDGERLI